ncbi:FecR domain-containing protein [uncultured Draconibacterium sp.]|uniref:FecR family protein n=1 Tax=uncultured Draconibacterium sp. TaxID=1573823 RepID=UPI0029C7FD42|nr:FecR domain-containing protein [uncultured Draconibacterium sp.]
MNKTEKNILSRFLANEITTHEELDHLKECLSDDREMEQLLREEWDKEHNKETKIQFPHIQGKIKELEKKSLKIPFRKKILISYQKVAAAIVLPLMAFSIYFAVNHFNSEPTYFQTIAECGQKSKIELPDGTKVWLNSDSKIQYPDNFGKHNRSIQLTGEAYFEVTKDVENPFLVEAGEVKVRVLGTRFNLKAYPDEYEIETTLFEGKVELNVQPEAKNIASRVVEMEPGESLIFNKTRNELQFGEFEKEEILAWTNNQLIFRNDNFENLVRKIERWYDVEIVYDKASLNNQRLTVELYQGELLFRLLDIIELAMDVECVSEQNKIYIKAKKK